MCTLLTDLAVYGSLQDGPKPFSQILRMAQNIAPEVWSPTSVVMADAVERGAQVQWLSLGDGNDPLVSSTGQGRLRLADLMMIDPREGCEPVAIALEELQLRYLDTVSSDVRAKALVRMRDRADQRLSTIERECRKCTSQGMLPPLWMRLERRRLHTSACILGQAAYEGTSIALTYDI